jgi:hypothetical protein
MHGDPYVERQDQFDVVIGRPARDVEHNKALAADAYSINTRLRRLNPPGIGNKRGRDPEQPGAFGQLRPGVVSLSLTKQGMWLSSEIPSYDAAGEIENGSGWSRASPPTSGRQWPPSARGGRIGAPAPGDE